MINDRSYDLCVSENPYYYTTPGLDRDDKSESQSRERSFSRRSRSPDFRDQYISNSSKQVSHRSSLDLDLNHQKCSRSSRNSPDYQERPSSSRSYLGYHERSSSSRRSPDYQVCSSSSRRSQDYHERPSYSRRSPDYQVCSSSSRRSPDYQECSSSLRDSQDYQERSSSSRHYSSSGSDYKDNYVRNLSPRRHSSRDYVEMGRPSSPVRSCSNYQGGSVHYRDDNLDSCKYINSEQCLPRENVDDKLISAEEFRRSLDIIVGIRYFMSFMQSQNMSFENKDPVKNGLIVYILRCKDDKYYVGKTFNFEKRYDEHLNGNGSEWTKIYPPIGVEELVHNADVYDEDKYVWKYMEQYGIDNVRGGSYSQIMLPPDIKLYINGHIHTARDLCFVCGGSGHFLKDCKKNFLNTRKRKMNDGHDGDGDDVEVDLDDEVHRNKRARQLWNGNKCDRCGRKGHIIDTCYAKTHYDGYYLNDYTQFTPLEISQPEIIYE